jgi:hypothetical protein
MSEFRNGVICYYCKKSSHIKKYCQKLKVKNNGFKRDQSRGRDNDDVNEHTAVIVFDGEVFITCDEDFINLTYHDST